MILSRSAQYGMIATNVDVNGSQHGPGVVTFEYNFVLGNFAKAQTVMPGVLYFVHCWDVLIWGVLRINRVFSGVQELGDLLKSTKN